MIGGPADVLLFHNPVAGAGTRLERLDELTAALQECGWRVQQVTSAESLRGRAERLLGSGQLRCVVAAGGDGTVRLVADQIPATAPLAIFPLGTENLLAKYLQMTADPHQLVHAVAHGRVARLDAGRANGRLFLVMFSCGFDAEVVHRLHAVRRGHIHHWSYAKPILEAIRRYQYPELDVRWEHGPTEPGGPRAEEACAASPCSAMVHWAFVFNVPSYAAGLPIAPEASPFDGRLNVVTFVGGSVWHGMYHLASVLMGTHRSEKDVLDSLACRIALDAPQPVPFQLDGDPGGMLPVEIEVVPQRLTVVVPPQWDAAESREADVHGGQPERGEGHSRQRSSEGRSRGDIDAELDQPAGRGEGIE